MKVYIVEACWSHEGCEAFAAFDNPKDAQDFANTLNDLSKSAWDGDRESWFKEVKSLLEPHIHEDDLYMRLGDYHSVRAFELRTGQNNTSGPD